MDLELEGGPTRGLRRYVRLVAEACGVGPDGFFLELERPLYAYLAVDGHLPRFPTRDIALWWQEENGWAAGIETYSGRNLVVLSYLGIDVLPAPHVVAQFLTELSGPRFPGQPNPPALRRLTDTDDLLDRLASYAQPRGDASSIVAPAQKCKTGLDHATSAFTSSATMPSRIDPTSTS